MNLDYVIETETKYDLLRQEIDGFHFWTYQRAEFIWEIERKKFALNTGHSMPQESMKERVGRLAGMVCNALLHGRTDKMHGDILFLNHERRILIDGKYECIYTDCIAEQFPNSVSLERPHHGRHYRPPRTQRLFYTDWIEMKKTLYYLTEMKLHPGRYRQIKTRIEEILREPLTELFRLYEVDCTMDYFVQLALAGYYDYQSKRKSYGRLLRRMHPRMIVEVVGYNGDCMIVNEIAKTMRIPTVELQHGASGREHIAYNYAQGTVLQQAPDYFLAFSEFWIDAARKPIARERQIAVGYPYLERQVERYRKKAARGTDPETILFLSQGPIGERLSAIAIRLRQLLPQEKYRIIYKLHPNEYADWRVKYPALCDADVEVVDHNDRNLYEYFAMSSAQVGGYTTTAVYEGTSFALNTYIYDYCVSPELRRLCEEGYGQFFQTAEQLAGLLQNRERNTVRMQVPALWKPGAQKNIVDWITGETA